MTRPHELDRLSATSVADRVAALLQGRVKPGSGVLAGGIAQQLRVDTDAVTDAMYTLYAAGLVRERAGGPDINYQSVWTWSPEGVSA